MRVDSLYFWRWKHIILTSRFERAIQEALRLHGGQLRKGTRIPYMSHLLAVASLVLEAGGTEEEVIGALFHDAAEDQGGEEVLSFIEEEFGPGVAKIVEECSDTLEYPKPPHRERKRAYIEKIPAKSTSARLVSLADKIHNARSILFDYREHGEALWDRFKGKKEGTLAYYGNLVEAFRKNQDHQELVFEFERLVDEIHRLASVDLGPGRNKHL